MKRKNIIAEIISLLYVCLMLYTAASKLIDYQLTREQMAMMPLLNPISSIIVWLLPLTEVVIAVLLFFPKTRLKGLKIVTALMIVFSIYIIYMMTYYEHLPCSCGGFLEMLTWSGHLIFNGIFILLGVIAIVLLKVKDQKQQNLQYHTA